MASLVVSISDYKIAKPPDILITYALGSCVGICLLDPVLHVAGLAHIMLPSRSISPGDVNVMKFADTAIPAMIRDMEYAGAARSRLVAKIAGGAQMFGFQNQAQSSHAMWQIGQRNVASVLEVLQSMGVPVAAQDVLKDYGRTVTFDPDSGVMSVRSVNRQITTY